MSHYSLLKQTFCIILLSIMAHAPVFAENTILDSLFKDLKHASSVEQARKLEQVIWKQWMMSGDDKVDELMQDALQKRRSYDFNGAIEVLNQVIKMKPDYAEGWNQRATVYFHQEEYEKSLIDIAKTLELEPRHFGSLAGRAIIRLRQNKLSLAMQNIIHALQFNPYLKEKDFFPNLTLT
ncbi:hypothetical protein OO007_17240 [Cocleimonas sp. KMM 6892]|uniref:tetratricopeptide repeat protein n=1 Tax=unclassified Cocleimonas TaxID=2639732 RepID=UPI002DB84D7E|nr:MULTISPECIES: hypothetical protein [unclassified Cocleimonas]MEB8433987.1 hypothetical protein [Cocleimonas sp. KMM 6892]MEC4716798.1 hypothetical protein [Cocleimonas sp. KMM 6895]MEC4746047.1 hypothetical protein [Cocleimonas sp. KMM 6896]